MLTKGVCDGCALGVAGLHDWTIDGVHLCTTRLRLLEVNTADALDPVVLADVEPLRRRSGAELRGLGRLGHPMRRRRGERRLPPHRVGRGAGRRSPTAIAAAGGDRTALYLTSRGITNEMYYVGRQGGPGHGHRRASTRRRGCATRRRRSGSRQTIGVAATTCSLQDVIESDLIVIWGANPANNQPVFMKYLYLARQRGCRVVVVNPYLEPGLERYWVPSNAESALFGTKMCDLHVPVRPGGDVAFASAALKRLIERGAVDERLRRRPHRRVGRAWSPTSTPGRSTSCSPRPASRGPRSRSSSTSTPRPTPPSCCGPWASPSTAMPSTACGPSSTWRWPGATSAATAPGSCRCGATRACRAAPRWAPTPPRSPAASTINERTAARAGRRLGLRRCPTTPGSPPPRCSRRPQRGELDVLWSSGGNFLDVLPDPAAGRGRARAGCRCGCTRTSCSSSQMLVPGDDVILLPVATRYEQEGGGTETTTERRIVFSPEIPRQVGEARSEWRLFADVATAGAARAGRRPSLARQPGAARGDRRRGAALRRHRAAVEPPATPCSGADGTCAPAACSRPPTAGPGSPPVVPPGRDVPEGMFTVATRRGKQFNSMVLAATDPLTGRRP